MVIGIFQFSIDFRQWYIAPLHRLRKHHLSDVLRRFDGGSREWGQWRYAIGERYLDKSHYSDGLARSDDAPMFAGFQNDLYRSTCFDQSLSKPSVFSVKQKDDFELEIGGKSVGDTYDSDGRNEIIQNEASVSVSYKRGDGDQVKNVEIDIFELLK